MNNFSILCPKNLISHVDHHSLQNAGDAIKDVMLYTYVDKDQFWTDKVDHHFCLIAEIQTK